MPTPNQVVLVPKPKQTAKGSQLKPHEDNGPIWQRYSLTVICVILESLAINLLNRSGKKMLVKPKRSCLSNLPQTASTLSSSLDSLCPLTSRQPHLTPPAPWLSDSYSTVWKLKKKMVEIQVVWGPPYLSVSSRLSLSHPPHWSLFDSWPCTHPVHILPQWPH